MAKLSCGTCGKEFKNNQGLRSHEGRMHKPVGFTPVKQKRGRPSFASLNGQLSRDSITVSVDVILRSFTVEQLDKKITDLEREGRALIVLRDAVRAMKGVGQTELARELQAAL